MRNVLRTDAIFGEKHWKGEWHDNFCCNKKIEINFSKVEIKMEDGERGWRKVKRIGDEGWRKRMEKS